MAGVPAAAFPGGVPPVNQACQASLSVFSSFPIQLPNSLSPSLSAQVLNHRQRQQRYHRRNKVQIAYKCRQRYLEKKRGKVNWQLEIYYHL